MTKNTRRSISRFVHGLPLLTMLLAGCSTTPGRGFTLFPEGHRLLDSAKAMRPTTQQPLPLPRELDKRVLPAYVVEPGDVLLVQPVDLDSNVRLPADQPVLPDGTINLGKYGRLIVAGRTVDEIEGLVHAAVEAQTKEPGFITVRLVTRQSKVYYVVGEVNAPGAFPLAGRETVLDALFAAGGLTDRASRANIILSRPTPPDGCRVVLPICYPEIVQLGDTTTNYQIAPGDRLYVPTRTMWEELTHSQKGCAPCGGPQTPCSWMGTDGHGSGDHALGAFQEREPHYPTSPPSEKPATEKPPTEKSLFEKLPLPTPLGQNSVTPPRSLVPPPPLVSERQPALLPAMLSSPVTAQPAAPVPAPDAKAPPVGGSSGPLKVTEPQWGNTSQATPGPLPALGAMGPDLKPDAVTASPTNGNEPPGALALFRRSF